MVIDRSTPRHDLDGFLIEDIGQKPFRFAVDDEVSRLLTHGTTIHLWRVNG